MSSGKEFTYGLNLQVKGGEQISAAQRLLDQFYASISKGVGEVTKFSSGFARGTQEVATSTQKLSQSSNTLTQAVNQQKTAFTGVQQGLTQYKGTTDQTVASQTRLGQATQQLQQHFNQEKTALMGASQSTTQLKTSTDQMVTSQTKVGTTLQQNTQQMNTYKTSQQQAVTGQNQFNQAAATSVSTMDRLKSSFGTLTLGVTTLTTGVFNLYNTYDNLNDQQLKLDTMEQKLARNKKQLSEAEEKYNKLLKDSNATQDDVADALRDVGLAQDRVRLSGEKLADAQDDLSRAWKDFYINVLPAAIQTLGGGAAAIGTFAGAMRGVKPAADTAKASLSTMGPAAAGAASSIGAVATGGSRLIPILGGIGAAIAVVGGSLLAVNQNFGGFRDIMNNVGEAIGTAVPQLEGVLNVIKGFAGQIGLSGEKTEEWQKALTEGVETVTAQFETLKQMAIPVLKGVEVALNEIGFAVEDWIGNVQKVVGVYQEMANSVSKFISDVQTGWDNLVKGAQSLGTQIKTAIDTGLAFLTNPATYTTAFSGLLDAAVEAGQNAVNIITSIIGKIGAFVFGNDVWGNLTKGAVEAAQNSVKIIQSVLSGVTAVFDQYIGKPAQQAANTIATAAGNLTPKSTDSNYEKDFNKALADQGTRAIIDRDMSSGANTTPSRPQYGPLNTGSSGQQFPTQKPQAPAIPMASGTAGGAAQGPAQSYVQAAHALEQLSAAQNKATDSQKAHSKESEWGSRMAELLGQKTEFAAGTAEGFSKSVGVAASATGELSKSQQQTIEGYNEQSAVLDKNVESLNKTAGGVTRLKEQLKEGVIQAVAFATGFKEAEKNFLNTAVTTSKLSGEVAFLSKNLGDAQGIAVRTAEGFVQGAKSVLDWAGSFDTMKGSLSGSRMALEDVAQTMGVTIPEGFSGGTAALKEFISYTKAAGPEFASLMDSIKSAAEGVTKGLGEALRKGNDEFKDEIEKLEEEWGFEFNNALTNALEGQAGVDAIDSLVTDMNTAIQAVGPAIADPQVWGNIREGFIGQIEETFDDFKKEGGKAANEAVQEIIDLLNAPLDTSDPLAISERIGEVQAKIVALKSQSGETLPQVVGDLNTVNEINFDDAIEQIDKLNLALKSIGSSSGAGGGPGAKAEAGIDITTGKTTSKSQGKEKGKTTDKGNMSGGVMAIDIAAFTANLDEATKAFTDFMQTLFTNAAGIPQGVMAGILPIVEMFNTQVVAPIVQLSIGTLGPGIVLGFDSARGPVEATLTAIRDAAAGTWTTIISDAQALGPGIAAGFSAARDQSAPHISGLAEDFASNAVVPIETMAEGLADTIGQAFEDGGARAEAALGGIESAADAARSAVEAIGQAVENLPDQKTITINIDTQGSIPSGLASGFEGVVGGRAGGHTFTAGEAGPELVSVIPLTRAFTGPGAPRGGNTPNPGGHTFAAEGFQGLVGASPDFATYRHGNLAGQSPSTIVISDVNIAMVGGRPVSSVGGVLGGIPVSIVSGNSGFVTGGGITGGNGLPSTGGNGGGGSSGGGGGGGTGGSNIQRQIDVMENGQRLFYYQNGSDIRTNMNAEQIARYVGSGAGPGTGSGGTPGGGTGGDPSGGVSKWGDYDSGTIQTTGGSKWSTNPGNPSSWQVVPMTDDPSKWKVVDASGKNVAAGFGAEDEARGYIEDKKAGKGYNDKSSPDYVASPGTGGGSPTFPTTPPTGGGGSGGGQGGQGEVYTVPNDVRTTDPGSAETEPGWQGPIDTSKPEEWRVVRMTTPNPATGEYRWKVVNKDNKHIAIRFNTQAEAQAYIDAHRRAKANGTYQIPTTGGGTLNVTGSNGTPGSGQQPPPSGGNGGGTGGQGGFDFDNQQPGPGEYSTSTGYVVPDYVQTPGHGTTGTSPVWQNPNMDPNGWRATEMTSRGFEGKWKVVDSSGINIAANFNSKAEAEDFIADHRTAYYPGGALPQPGTGGTGGNNPPPTTGGGGGGGTTNPPPTTGGGGGGGTGGTGGQTGSVVQIRVQENGQTLFYERDANGAVRTNMNAAQIAQYVGAGAPGPSTGGGNGGGSGGTGGGAGPNIGGIQFPPGFPFQDTPKGPGGGPIIGGIEFPPGFPFHNMPGNGSGGGGGGVGGGYPGLLAGMGLPYSMISPRVTTDTSIPTTFNGFSGSGYIGTEVGAGGRGRVSTIPGGVGVPFGWPFGSGSITTGNPNQGTTTITKNGITQTQSWNQSSNIVSNGNIVGRGNNINIQHQSNTGNNVGGINFPPGFPFGGTGSIGSPSGNPLGGAQYYDSSVVENAEGTERHPVFRTNMNQAQMVRLLAMMEASGQQVPYYTSGEPALTGFRYNAAGWTGSRPIATARQLRTGRDNHTPIWDVGNPTMPSDFGTLRNNMGVTGNIGGGSPFPGGGFDWGGLIDKITGNIMAALQAALAKVAININLNNSNIGDAATKLMMRRISGGF